MVHDFPVRVYYEDTDMAGIVYHANYLKYIERARSDWVRGLGIDQRALREAGLVFVVRRIESDYLAPARFDDELQVRTAIRSITGARLGLHQEVTRAGKALFQAEVTLVCVTLDGHPARLPAQIRGLLH